MKIISTRWKICTWRKLKSAGKKRKVSPLRKKGRNKKYGSFLHSIVDGI